MDSALCRQLRWSRTCETGSSESVYISDIQLEQVKRARKLGSLESDNYAKCSPRSRNGLVRKDILFYLAQCLNARSSVECAMALPPST
jgi:hypothetical protein